MTHGELVTRAGQWLKSQGCSVIMEEIVSLCQETADAIGFTCDQSYLAECKASHSDFVADAKKLHRRHPEYGMGNYRFYLCEPGVISEDEVPLGWGLLYALEKKVKQVRGMRGNCGAVDAGVFQFAANIRSERTLLLSALRRGDEDG